MIGNKIKLLREELKINQEELAKKINVSPSTIAMYETNKRQPNYETLSKLADIFNCTTDYLLGKSDKRNNDIDFNPDLLQIGLSTKDYNISEDKKKAIEEFAKLVLKDDKKDKENK